MPEPHTTGVLAAAYAAGGAIAGALTAAFGIGKKAQKMQGEIASASESATKNASELQTMKLDYARRADLDRLEDKITKSIDTGFGRVHDRIDALASDMKRGS